MNELREHLSRVQEVWRQGVGVYQSLPPEQQADARLVGLVLLAAAAVGLAYLHYGHNVVAGLPWLLVRVPLCAAALPVVGIARLSGRRWSVPELIWRDWPRQPDPDAPRIPETNVKPMHTPKRLQSGQIPIFGEVHSRVYSVGQIGEPGSGKDEGGIGPTLYHQLEHGVDDVVVLDPKAEQLWRAVTYGLIRPGDDLYVFGSSPVLACTDAISPFHCPRPKTVLSVICEDPTSPHFQDSGAAVIHESSKALDIPSLLEIKEVITDPSALEELTDTHPRTRVTANEREFGSAVSTARRALDPLDHPRAARLFEAEPRMPDFHSPRRQVCFVCPDPSASDESRLTAATVEALFQLAAESPDNRCQLFLLNEAGSFASLPRLPQYVELGRGQQIYTWYVGQSFSQLETRLGAAKVRALWNASSAQIVGSGCEKELAETMASYTAPDRFPHREPAQHYQSWQEAHVREERRNELTPHDITSLEPGQYVCRIGPKTRRLYVPESEGQSAYLERHYSHRKGGRNHGSEYLQR